ncbi:hypothetical protein LXL04_038372 [Taraxacum kok-saghyz]
MAYMARRPYSSTLGSLAHATVSMVFYGEDLEISNTGRSAETLMCLKPHTHIIRSIALSPFVISPISVTFLKCSELVLSFRHPWFFPIWVFHVNPCVSVIYHFIRISLTGWVRVGLRVGSGIAAPTPYSSASPLHELIKGINFDTANDYEDRSNPCSLILFFSSSDTKVSYVKRL